MKIISSISKVMGHEKQVNSCLKSFPSSMASIYMKGNLMRIIYIMLQISLILTEFILHLNTVHSTLQFTSVISSSEIAFLDLTIYVTDDKLCTRLYTKNKDRHMYLNFNSEHPMNLKKIYTLFSILETQENPL